MNKSIIRFYYITGICCLGMLLSCKKEWLEIKSDQSQVAPVEISQFQALMDNDGRLNGNFPVYPSVASDDYYITTDIWKAASTRFERNAYIWAKDVYEGEPSFEWNYGYQNVYWSNVVLEGIEKIKPTAPQQAAWNNVKGSALFFRSYSFFDLATSFCKPYQPATAGTVPGVPLRLSSDVNAVMQRGTLEQTYNQLIDDLKQAASLLPNLPVYKTRPSRVAALACLARVYLSMGDYTNAERYADSSLKIYPNLLNYNTAKGATGTSFARFTEEVLFWGCSSTYGITRFSNGNSLVLPELYNLYTDNNDLRKTMLFTLLAGKGNIFIGMYTGLRLSPFFKGLANDETYLISAECKARRNDKSGALDLLNKLLVQRWKTGTFIPVTAADAEAALKMIILERRKEMPYRGLRWIDQRRLAGDKRFEETITRTIDGQTYTLEPGSSRYVYPVPDEEIRLTGIQQNER